MSSQNGSNDVALVRQADAKAEENKWIEAANLCEHALSLIEKVGYSPKLTSLTEFSARCNFRAAFQAPSRATFKERMLASKARSEKARDLYDKAQLPILAKRAQTEAIIAEFWTQDHPKERLVLIRSLAAASSYAAEMSRESEKPEKGLETQVRLLTFFREFINLATDFESLKKTFNQAMLLGRNILGQLGKETNLSLTAQALNSMVWLVAVEAEVILPPSQFQSLASEARQFVEDLQQVSQKSKASLVRCLALEGAGHLAFDIVGNPTLALADYEESLSIAKTLADSLVIGRLEWSCSQTAFWLGYTEKDPEKKHSLFEKSMRYATDSIKDLEIPLQTTELSAAGALLAQCLVQLANLTGTNIFEKRKLLNEATNAASRAAKLESGTWAWSLSANALAQASHHLSKIETSDEKLRLLREALNAREHIVRVSDQLFPHFWNNVLAPYNAALVRSEIATLTSNVSAKKELLIQAVSELEVCLQRSKDWGTNTGFVYRIAEHNETYGEILSRLFAITGDQSLGYRAIEAYEKSIRGFETSRSTPNVAALRWKIARIYDNLHSFHLASGEFRKSAEDYRKAVSDVPGSAPLFENIAQYLDAWFFIETARLRHDEGESLSASEDYSTAAGLLAKTVEWAYLATLFAARSFLEKGEGLSSEENHPEAIGSFEKARDEFRKEGNLLEEKLRETKDTTAKGGLEAWFEIARQREMYCHARLELEEARSLDKQGEKNASAAKFRSSSETLTSLSTRTFDNQERTELEGLARFCEGWALMKEADAQASPEKYSEAAESFLKLRSSQTKEQLLFLALANAAICKALGAGTMFQQTRDVKDYADVKRQTEAAADYFRQAGFKKTEAWTRATQRLYDALIFVTDAESEHDPTRKTELYHQAENHLRIAARLYGEAGFPAKKEDATSQLQRIMEEKRVLMAPLEALSQIPTATASSLTISPRGRGQPIGAQRFDEAYVVGDVNIQHREVSLGSTFTVDLEIANVGKSSATLVKLQNALSEGLEPVGEQGTQVSSNGEVNLLGRTLEHLKTHVIKIQTRANRKGEIQLRPRLFYADDSGTYKTYQFSPTILTVLDVGLPVRPIAIAPPATPSVILGAEFRFETGRARDVFQRLAREFLLDYMSKRLYVEKAGWRSLVQIIQGAKIPRSSLYGPRGRDGPVLVELERRGLIESRIFPKERGRGGAVKKIRIAYDNLIVKKLIEQMVVDNSGR